VSVLCGTAPVLARGALLAVGSVLVEVPGRRAHLFGHVRCGVYRLAVDQLGKDDANRLYKQDEDDRHEEEAVPAEEYRAQNIRKQQDERVEMLARHVRLEKGLREDVEEQKIIRTACQCKPADSGSVRGRATDSSDTETTFSFADIPAGMAETLTCPDCDKEIETTADLEESEEITEIETDGETVSPYADKTGNLFLCGGCKRPLGFERH